MQILKAKIDWMLGYGNHPRLHVLVDREPKLSDFKFECKRHYYFAEHDGFVQFFAHDIKDHGGFGGDEFELNMKDGSVVKLVGPWSSRCSVMNKLGFTPSFEVDYVADPIAWDKGYTFVAGAMTINKVREAIELANSYEACPAYLIPNGHWNMHDDMTMDEWSWVVSINPHRYAKPAGDGVKR